jgi:hypothetical protein
MSEAEAIRLRGFWPVQVGGWALLYALILIPAFPHLREPGILAYNTWAVIFLFSASVALRPLLRCVSVRWGSSLRFSWLRLEGSALGLCFLFGTAATFLTALLTFGLRGFRWSYWTLSGVQCTMALFLWATLYLSVKHWRRAPEPGTEDHPMPSVPFHVGEFAPERPAYPVRFATRVGSRIQIVTPDEVLWVAAARDYAEFHTGTSVHLLRETLRSLESKLDPERFLRIHRSRIVRVDQIVELMPLDNGEFRIKLRDGSEHRSSRTYAAALANWLHTSAGKG